MSNIMIISQSLTGGGAEKLVANLSLELAKTDNVTIVTFCKSEKEFKYAGNRINIDRIGGKGGLITHILNAIGRIKDVRRIKKEMQCDCAISFIPQTDYVNVLSRRKQEKVIVDVVSNMSFVYPRGIKKIFRKYILKKADYVVTVSEGVRDDLIENFQIKQEKSKTIYNSCDINAIKNDCINKTEYEKIADLLPPKYICSMGSFRLAKGHWHLIKAFSCIASKIPEYKLVILGDGQYRDKYNLLIKKLGLEERVILPGFANPPYSIISKSSLFVFSSVFEGFGHSIIEAMACGVPVLSTDCNYGAREIIAPNTHFKQKADSLEKDEFGYLLPPFNMDDIDCSTNISELEHLMGNSILQVLIDDNSALVERSMKYIDKFDNSSYGKYWKELIEDIIHGR